MSKRTLDTFFQPSTKRAKQNNNNAAPPPHDEDEDAPPDTHPSYPIPIPQFPSHISIALTHGTPARQPRTINNHPNLDLLYFQPYIARPTANELFKFLRGSLPFYRVQYTIKRGGVETSINTPRYTTVFGVDETSIFTPKHTDHNEENKNKPPSPTPISNLTLVERTSRTPVRSTKYKHTPRPIPTCLTTLQQAIQSATGSHYNFCLVNYYASGNDSIAFHSDDERFLGPSPDIASLSLGGQRDFVMKHKPLAPAPPHATNPKTTRAAAVGTTQPQPLKFPLLSGDMVVMRGPTQSNWLHSIPKRTRRDGEGVTGRMNITFRRAMVPAGTENYYRYNVGEGGVWRWDEGRQEMVMTEEKGYGIEM